MKSNYVIQGTYSIAFLGSCALLIGDGLRIHATFYDIFEFINFLSTEKCTKVWKDDGEIKVRFEKDIQL